MDRRREELIVLAGLIVATPGLLGIGGAWDAQWHWTIGRDTIWLPAHMLLYAGIALNGLIGGLMLLRGRRDPAALFLSGGVATIFAAAVFDAIWHVTIGDRTVWSPPHVFLVIGSLAIGLGMAAEFIRAGRQHLIAQSTVMWGVRMLGATFVVAGWFGLAPAAMLVFGIENTGTNTIFKPSIMTLLTLLSGVIPAMMVLAIRAVGTAGLHILMGTTIGLWLFQEAFHLTFTIPVALALGYVVNPELFGAWPFHTSVFVVGVAPLAVLGSRLVRQPEFAGAVAGAFYALAVQLGLILTGIPARVNPGMALFSILLGSASVYVTAWFSEWLWGVSGLIPSTKPRTS